jgi:hypothetical protein
VATLLNLAPASTWRPAAMTCPGLAAFALGSPFRGKPGENPFDYLNLGLV